MYAHIRFLHDIVSNVAMVTMFYLRLYFPTLLQDIVVSVEELDVRNCLIAPYSLPFLSFSCRAMYFVLEYVRDEIPSELREKVCR